MLPFSREAFLAVFASYNAAMWPAQVLAYGLGLATLLAIRRSDARSARMATFILGLFWLWTGIAYHALFFAVINPAAFLFAALFALQGVALLLLARRGGHVFRIRRSWEGATGAFLIAYAMLIYPVVSLVTGRIAELPSFGITPCPLTLFSLGFLLLAEPRPPLWAWLIPLIWSLIGGTAAFLLGVVPDWLLLASGPAAMLLALRPGHGARTKPGMAQEAQG